ncbi:MAG: PadR family transcriptional regulator [Paenibacillus sp.]|nr:PadR family transcriptional regulator [Paenibacillus sp.]
MRERQRFLEEAWQQIRKKYEGQGSDQLPLHVRALFLHPLKLIENEKSYSAVLISELEAEVEEHAHDH